ncbi:beta strand repeat-containing protein, partial [Acaryochloris marina NIES-2412]|uniref:beta strand repeat-containing protein n=1 Tax=Acaryochloris marina TaxID=155978 RepID=UPI0040584A44
FQVTVTDAGGLTAVQDIAVSVTDVVAEGSPPSAQNQTYNTLGNSVLEVAGADVPGTEVASITSSVSLLTGATDPDVGDTLSVQAGTFTTTQGGSITTFSDGSFYYQPEAGDVNLADTFTFTVLDGTGNSVTATATFNVGNEAIYVDDDTAAGTGDGSSFNPFTTLAEAQAVAGNDDVIYVADGTYNESLTLETNQFLIGQGADFSLGGTVISGAAATSPDITGNITLANNNTVQGINVNGNVSGNNVGNLTIEEVIFSSSTSILNVTNTTANATLNITNNTLTPTNPTGTNLTRFRIDNDANNAVVNITGNTINRGTSTGDALRFENSGTGVAATISNNDIDATGFSTGTGLEVLSLAGVLDILLANNTVDGTGTFHFLIDVENNSTVNATVTGNSVPTGIAPSTANNASLALNAEDNATLNVSVTGNNMQSANGGGIFENDIVFVDSGAGATVNVVQADTATVSTANNGDTVGVFGNNVNFGVPLP